MWTTYSLVPVGLCEAFDLERKELLEITPLCKSVSHIAIPISIPIPFPIPVPIPIPMHTPIPIPILTPIPIPCTILFFSS